MSKHEQIPMTQDERRAIERDALMLETVRRINGPGAPSIKELFPNSIPVSDLDAAASCGQLFRVKAALNAGAEINAIGPFGTALHGAAENGHLDIVRLLVEHGADVSILDPVGRTAKAAAQEAGHSPVAEYLGAIEDQRLI